jgi:RND family efflux transporter MFP subunit
MSRVTIIGIAAAVAIIVIIGLAIWIFRDPEPDDTVTVTRGSIDVTIETVGRVAVRDAVSVRAGAGGQVRLVAAQAGESVRQGDVIVQLERGPFDLAVQRAEDQLAVAESALAVIEADGDATDPATFVERINAQQRVRDAEAAVQAARENLVNTLVLAPQDGTVLFIAAVEGAAIAENAEIAQVAGLREFELVLDIDEIDFPYVEVGAATAIILEAYPEYPINGVIDSIARQAQLVGGATVFPATLVFTAPAEILVLPGMNAEVEITTDVRTDVLLVPEQALHTVGRRTFVDVVVDGRVERREIRIGLRSQGLVEVAAGLSEGDEVVLQ